MNPPAGAVASWVDGELVVSGCCLPELLAVAPAGAFPVTGSSGDSRVLDGAPALDSASADDLHVLEGAPALDSASADGAERPHRLIPTAGRWTRARDSATFAPRFLPGAGIEFVVVGRASEREPWRALARATVAAREAVGHTVVTSVDPTSAEVPANLLRFAVAFSAEMEEGSAAGRIRLVEGAGTTAGAATGAEKLGALLEMPPELWDRQRMRLTVLLEPGRLKRGLQPRVLAGSPLAVGETITLVVEQALRDSSGHELTSGAGRTYRVGEPVRRRVDPRQWRVDWPQSFDGPLRVRFDRPLDRALVTRCLQVRDARGHPVPGAATLDDAATEWVFTSALSAATEEAPEERSWTLHVDSRLEDLAGNSVRRVFDRDLSRPEDAPLDISEVVLTPDH